MNLRRHPIQKEKSELTLTTFSLMIDCSIILSGADSDDGAVVPGVFFSKYYNVIFDRRFKLKTGNFLVHEMMLKVAPLLWGASFAFVYRHTSASA